MQSPPSVQCIFSIFRTDWPLTSIYCMWVDRDHGSQEIEGQGHRSRSRSWVRLMRSVWPQSRAVCFLVHTVTRLTIKRDARHDEHGTLPGVDGEQVLAERREDKTADAGTAHRHTGGKCSPPLKIVADGDDIGQVQQAKSHAYNASSISNKAFTDRKLHPSFIIYLSLHVYQMLVCPLWSLGQYTHTHNHLKSFFPGQPG